MIVNAMFTSWLASLNLVSVIRILPVLTSTRQKMTHEAKKGTFLPAVLHSIVREKSEDHAQFKRTPWFSIRPLDRKLIPRLYLL
jgi:hypothetical protein